MDLRWGITEAEARANQTLGICLDEIASCNFFIGMLGERYGWAPETYSAPAEPRFDWVRDYPTGRSITELEMHFAALHDPSRAQGRAIFALRSPSLVNDVPKEYRADFGSESADDAAKMSALKQRIREAGLSLFDGYDACWGGVVGGKPIAAGLEQFGHYILSELWASIVQHMSDDTPVSSHADETRAQHNFIRQRSSTFQGRPALLKEVARFVENSTSGLLCLKGSQGIGKSSVLAAVVEKHVQNAGSRGVVSHFVGVTPASTDIRSALFRICSELVKRFALDADVPSDMQGLKTLFDSLLRDCVRVCGGKLLLFFDALDQLDDVHQARTMDWMPAHLPSGVIVIATVTEGDVYSVLRERQGFHEIAVAPLSFWDRAGMVRTTLGRYRKKLDESPFNNQLKELLAKKDSGMPVFLFVACEELRVGSTFETLSKSVRALSTSLPGLLTNVLERLERECGASLVSMVLQFFALARGGLRDADVRHLLEIAGQRKIHGFELPSPIAVSSVLLALEPYLLADDKGCKSLFHAVMSACVAKRYLSASNARLIPLLHDCLASHYRTLADPKADGSFPGRDAQALRDLVFHLSRAGSWAYVSKLLSNLLFIRAKCIAGLGQELMRDYAIDGGIGKVAEREQAKVLLAPPIVAYAEFVSRNLHILCTKPALTVQQALNEASGSQLEKDALELLKLGLLILFASQSIYGVDSQATTKTCTPLHGATSPARGAHAR